MKITFKITAIQPVETCTFRDGTQHQVQNIWVKYETSFNCQSASRVKSQKSIDDGPQTIDSTKSASETWHTIIPLWDESIERFAAMGYKEFDFMEMELTLGYRKSILDGREVFSRQCYIKFPQEQL